MIEIIHPNTSKASDGSIRDDNKHCCKLLSNTLTVKKNSRSPACLVSEAVLQCPNCPTALLLPSRLIPKLQPMERPAACTAPGECTKDL